jgi:hypothetical protein
MLFGSCKKEDDSSTAPTATSSFWKQTGKQYWWMPRDQNNQFGPLVQIPAIPYNTYFTVAGYTYYIGGMENNVSCKDSAHVGGTVRIHTFTWDLLPTRMVADTLYPIAGQASGPWAGGLLISNSGDYTVNNPSFTNDWIINTPYYAGRATGMVRIRKPANVNNPPKMAIMVCIACAYGQIYYIHMYDWVTE